MDKKQLKEFDATIKWCQRAIEKNSGCIGLPCYDCPFIPDSDYCNQVNHKNDLSPVRAYLEWKKIKRSKA